MMTRPMSLIEFICEFNINKCALRLYHKDYEGNMSGSEETYEEGLQFINDTWFGSLAIQ